MLRLALVFVPLLAAAGLYSLRQLSRAGDWVQHTDEVRLALADLQATAVDAETSVRGYVITGDASFLHSYHGFDSAWRERFSHVRALTADNPAQQALLAKLDGLGHERALLLQRLRSEHDAGRSVAELAATMLEGKLAMDAIRGLMAELQREEQRLDTIRQEELQHRRATTVWLFVAGALAFAAVVFGAWRSRHKSELQERAAEERFRFMIASVKDYAIITLDKEGRVTSWNRGAQETKGWNAGEIIGQSFTKFYSAEDVAAGKPARGLEIAGREGRFEEEGWRVRKDGSRFWANVVINAIRDEGGGLVGFIKVTRDLTSEKLAADALADEFQRRTDAERESRFAQMFIGILGHDLRNPLNAISMAARLLSKKVGRADPKVIERITMSARRMSNMVDQLLDLTRSRLAGGIPVVKKPANLSEIVTTVTDELRLAHPDREIRWQAGDGNHRCLWDADRMAQVVSNLVGNAIQHSAPGTPITVKLERRPSDIALSVHNEGPPIPEERLPHIFEPYHRVTARSQGSSGLGLGLFIAQQVVRAHEGTIEVRSTPTDGTTFIMILPCRAELASTDDIGYRHQR
jgi:PAS domain S-box-containing protein